MKSSGIGGQAVLEGVMMKNNKHCAVAVRKPDNQIEIKIDEFHGIGERGKLFRLPIFRGVAAFVDSLVLGVRALTYSSGLNEEEEKQTPKMKDTLVDIGVVALSVFMAVVVFILLPLLLSNLLGRVVHSATLLLLLEGVLRIVMFVAYVALISRLEDIKRVFMYHGAEHKCINCVENGEELTVANAKNQSRCHKRCGTSFLLVVMLVSFVLFMFIRVRAPWLRYVLRVVLIPVIAGISYEFIRLAGSSDNKIVALLGKPGLLLQKLTTREPDDSMLEVAIASVEAVFDWQAYQEKEGIAKQRRAGNRMRTFMEQGKELEKVGEGKNGELASLDRLFVTSSKRRDGGLAAAREKEDSLGMKNRTDMGQQMPADRKEGMAGEEEDDDILRALDRFFVYENEEDASQKRRREGKK